jgi:hypothetical protein
VDVVQVHSGVVVMVSTPLPPLAAIVGGASASEGAHLTGDGAVTVVESDVHEAAVNASNNGTSVTRPAARIAGPYDVNRSPSIIGAARFCSRISPAI